MLLCRFEVDVTPSMHATEGERIRMTVSMYRRSVDMGYRQMVLSRIEAGGMDKYILVILRNILSEGMARNKIY